MKKKIYKLLSIEFEDNEEDEELANQTLELFETVEGVKLEDIRINIGGGFKLGKV